jgi:predicted double-glycine peptidase
MKVLNNSSHINLPRIAQQTDSHCGPATIQILLAFLGQSVTQDEVVIAARAKLKLDEDGTRPDQLARAVRKLTPNFQFWFKQKASIQDVATLIREHHWPVAVNWQGLFYDSLEEEQLKNPNGDHGHYSIAIAIDEENDQIIIADPYSEYFSDPREFSLAWFEQRWWDEDKHRDRKTKRMRTVKTDHFIFIITPKDAEFPRKVGMKPAQELKMFKR